MRRQDSLYAPEPEETPPKHPASSGSATVLAGRSRGRPLALSIPREVYVSSGSAARLDRGETFVLSARPVPLEDGAQRQISSLQQELESMRLLLPPQKRGRGIVSQGDWSVFAEKVVAERDDALASRRALAVACAALVRQAWLDVPEAPLRQGAREGWACSSARRALMDALREAQEESVLACLADEEGGSDAA